MRLQCLFTQCAVLTLAVGCATVQRPPIAQDAPQSTIEQREAQEKELQPQAKALKHKIGIGRFTNETRYGKALLGGDIDPLGRQTSDMLARRLTESGKFLVLELPDLGLVELEQARAGITGSMPRVDVLIVGSLTEFGRNVTGRQGFLSDSSMQTAYAKVDVRLVDVRTAHAFFATSGAGEASLEAGGVAGFGNRATYDSTLNDKAIGAAVDDLLNEIVSRLADRAWRTYVIEQNGSSVIIEGGPSQGLRVGDELVVKKSGKVVVSQQTGFPIELPGTVVARLRVTGHFNEDTTGEGSIAEITEGTIAGIPVGDLYIEEH